MFLLNNPSSIPSDSHTNWSNEKFAAGWVYGDVKDAEKKTHPCLVPYSELPEEQKVKDAIFQSVASAGLDSFEPGFLATRRDALLRRATFIAHNAMKELVNEAQAHTDSGAQHKNSEDLLPFDSGNVVVDTDIKHLGVNGVTEEPKPQGDSRAVPN